MSISASRNSYHNAQQREVARKAVHSLKGKKAAPRILMGACLAGDIDREETCKAFELMNGNKEKIDELVAGKRQNKTLRDEVAKAGTKILFIDDEYESAGWSIVLNLLVGEESMSYASSKEEALRLIERGQDIAVVLLDLNLPSKPEEGVEALTEIKQARPDIPVVMFTGEDTVRYQRKCFEKGCFDYFVKEFEEEEKDYVAYYEIFRNIVRTSLSYSEKAAFWRTVSLLERQVREEGPPYFEQEFHHLRKACYFLADEGNDWRTHVMLSQHGVTHYGEVIIQCANAIEKFVNRLAEDNKHRILEFVKKDKFDRLSFSERLDKLVPLREVDIAVSGSWKEIYRLRNECAHPEKKGLHLGAPEAKETLEQTIKTLERQILSKLRHA